jgi:hypothetical protein
VPWTQVEKLILPAIAEALNGSGAAAFLDSNGDGKITAEDLTSGVLGSFFRPDVDLDGDGKEDALSMGFGFDAVPCYIVDYL